MHVNETRVCAAEMAWRSEEPIVDVAVIVTFVGPVGMMLCIREETHGIGTEPR
jgi:hypothetical protein